jgi:hypothetical protein
MVLLIVLNRLLIIWKKVETCNNFENKITFNFVQIEIPDLNLTLSFWKLEVI